MRMRFYLTLALLFGGCTLARAADFGACTSRTPLSLDITSSVRTAEVSEALTYDSKWYGDSSSIVRLRINNADFAEATGVGEKTWEPHRPGTYTITATTYQSGSIVGDVLSAEFEVVGRDLVDATISLPDGNPLYDGTQRTPRVNVVYQGETLVEGQDYTVSYDENISGVGKVIVTGMGRFHDEVEQTFKIVPAGVFSLDICSGTRVANLPETITYDENWFSNTGAGYIRIMENGSRVAQENGRGEYSWSPIGNGLYTLLHRTYIDGYLQNEVYSATFFVGGGSLQQDGITVAINPDTFQYDGTPKTPAVSVTHDGFALKEGQDYSVSYRDNIEVGTGYAVVTGIGRYEDVVEKPFSIVEADGIYRVSAKQRYPWNGKVDIRFDSVGQQYTVSLVAKDLVGGTNIAIRTVYSENGSVINANGATVSPGSHRWVWDADPDIPIDFDFANVAVSVNIGGSVLVGATKLLEMSVDGYTGTETLSNVPVLVRLSTAISGFSYDDLNDNGSDLVFCDETGSTIYPHEIDEWHTDGESLVWVKLPQLRKGTKFKMGYGGTVATSATIPKTAVWSDYAGVWHMNEDSGTAFDSTAHGLDATPSKGTNTLADISQMVAYESGACGRARVNGTINGKGGSYLRTPASPHYSFGGEFVAGGWFRVENQILVSGTANYDDPRLISMKPEHLNQRTGFEVQLEDGKFCCKAQTNTFVVTKTPIALRSWINLVANYKDTNVLMYANGVLVTNGIIKAVVDNTTSELAFGNSANGGIWSLNGQYDEIRLRGGSLSADRIKADYDIIANRSFLAYGEATIPAHAVDSDVFMLSIKHDGVRASNGDETLTYSSLWNGDTSATVSIAQDGAVLADGLAGEGEQPWNVRKTGTYTLTHTTFTNGVIGKVETATFVVYGPELSFDYDNGPLAGGLLTINGGVDGWRVYYTIDGSVPTTASAEYGESFTLSDAATVRAFAVSAGGMETPVVGREYALVKRAGIENVKARQRYPWNGKVDVDFTLTGSVGKQYCVALTAEDVVGGTNLPMRTMVGHRVPTPPQSMVEEFLVGDSSAITMPMGGYRFTWDADADLPDGFECDQVSVKVKALGDGAFTYYVRFNANGGEGTMDDEMYIYGVEKALAANAFIRDGYEFKGWATSTDGSTAYDDRQSVSNLATAAEAVVDLYAVWEQKLYMVIDLSAGANASTYPVSYLVEAPNGGWSEEYKTTKLVLRRIEPGTFRMLGTYNVTLTKPYYMGIFEVTQKQFDLIMGSNPSYWGSGDTRPVACMSYYGLRGESLGQDWPLSSSVDSTSVIGIIRRRTGLDFDLPTEAQWEYACRAGTSTAYNNGGNTEDDLKEVGRYKYNVSDGRGGYTSSYTAVGSYAPNAWGLYDMHGNVYEWCLDRSSSQTYNGNTNSYSDNMTDPKGYDGSDRNNGAVNMRLCVVRGGSFHSDCSQCTSDAWRADTQGGTNSYYDYGFRLCLTLQ